MRATNDAAYMSDATGPYRIMTTMQTSLFYISISPVSSVVVVVVVVVVV